MAKSLKPLYYDALVGPVLVEPVSRTSENSYLVRVKKKSYGFKEGETFFCRAFHLVNMVGPNLDQMCYTPDLSEYDFPVID